MKINLFEDFPLHSKKDWRDQISQDLKGKDFEKTLVSVTEDGIKIDPFYAIEDMSGSNSFQYYRNRVNPEPSIPGLPPRIWANVSYFEGENEKSTNAEIIDALLNGADALLLHLGGKEDLNVLLKGVEPQYIQLFLSTNGDPVLVLKKFLDWVSQNGCEPESFQGGILWDGFGSLLSKKSGKKYVVETASSLLQMSEDFPGFKVFSIDASVYHNSGASPVQELTFSLAAWIDLIELMVEAGFYPQEIIQKSMFRLAVGSDYFLEIAKVKAARILMHRLISLYQIEIPVEDLFLFVQTSYWTKTMLDADTDMVRNTTEAMAAIIGGANALYVLPHEIAVGRPGQLSKRMARNVSNILKEESYLDKVLDPVAGSYFLENMISVLFQKVKNSMEEIEKMGGWWPCYESGFIQKEVKTFRNKKMEDILEGKKSKIGVNKYTMKKNIPSQKYGSKKEEEWALLPCRESMLSEKTETPTP
jgi:methylmalonyl-CoA mutase